MSLAKFLAAEIRRQARNAAGNDFATVSEVSAEGRARVNYRGGIVEVNPAGVVEPGSSINLNRGRGLIQFDGDAMYTL